ncbi:MAG: penicillin-binding protein 1A [Magnetospirillum sp. WYHS-4]
MLMRLIRFVAMLFGIATVLAIAGAVGAVYVFHEFGRDLPDYRQLADYEPPVTTRVHAGDGRLLAEYAVEKRVFVPIHVMPKHVVQAFLSAEDKHFYQHQGIDPLGIVRAALTNVKQMGSGRRPAGASTITQQVAKNFLLTNEVSIARKIKEAILAFRIEQAFSKQRILELYLNEIYLGFSAYGVAAASVNYFNKSLDELTVAEAAYLAALPKAPNNYHPIQKHEAAKARRDWVISRMEEDGVLTAQEAQAAMADPLIVRQRNEGEQVRADVFAEEVRRELAQRFGETALYKGGLLVRTTLDPRLQDIAVRALRRGLERYDRRHGWRGPLNRIDIAGDWMPTLRSIERPKGTDPNWTLAVVIHMDDALAEIGLPNGTRGRIPLSEMKWARAQRRDDDGDETLGPPVKKPAEVVGPGDVILVESLAGRPVDGEPDTDEPPVDAKGKPLPPKPLHPAGIYGLRQVPEIDGAIVALDPHTGRVLAMVGGYAYERSQFNRAVQAHRQPGSAFKPFVYLPALEEGYTPSTLILDAPFVIDQGPGLPKWRPENYTQKFYGPSTMRLGIEKSRNLMTVRLAQTIGMEKVVDSAKRFHVVDSMDALLSAALGSTETSLLRLTTAYAMLVNGGKAITPSLIDRIQDRNGRTVFRHDARPCASCRALQWAGQEVPAIPDNRKPVTDPASAYQMVSMLQGVVERGTGTSIKAVGKPLAGKTGTTNNSMDTWFVGFSPDLAVGVFMGYDELRPLGKKETGGSVSAPIFRDFMMEALKGKPATPFRIPPGIRMVRVKASDGRPAGPGDTDVILEAFKPDNVPSGRGEVLEGRGSQDGPASGFDAVGSGSGDAPSSGTGGLY